MLLATALALLITRDVLNRRLLFKTNRQRIAPKYLPSRFFVSGIGQKKTVDAAKICGGAENVVKTETQQTFVNGLSVFTSLGIYILRWKRVLLPVLHELPIDMGNSIYTAH